MWLLRDGIDEKKSTNTNPKGREKTADMKVLKTLGATKKVMKIRRIPHRNDDEVKLASNPPLHYTLFVLMTFQMVLYCLSVLPEDAHKRSLLLGEVFSDGQQRRSLAASRLFRINLAIAQVNENLGLSLQK